MEKCIILISMRNFSQYQDMLTTSKYQQSEGHFRIYVSNLPFDPLKGNRADLFIKIHKTGYDDKSMSSIS